MACGLEHYFVSMLMLVFAIASIIAGIFTAYFGSGKSRAVGVILILLGLIVGILFLWCAWLLPFLPAPPIGFVGCLQYGVITVVGAVVGALIALGLFLLAIMKA